MSGGIPPEFVASPVSDDVTGADVVTYSDDVTDAGTPATATVPETHSGQPNTYLKHNNIRDPAPDFGYFPNVGNVLNPGSIYLETAVLFESFNDTQSDLYTIPILFRVGLVKDLELRLSFEGVAHNLSTGSESETTSDLIGAGFRYFISEGNPKPFGWPSVGLEFQLEYPAGPNKPDNQNAQPSATLNFVNILPADLLFNWDIGAGTVVDSNGRQFVQGMFFWALQYTASTNLAFYLTGSVDHPTSDAGSGTDSLAGGGLQWIWNDRFASNFLYSVGLTSEAPDVYAGVTLTSSF